MSAVLRGLSGRESVENVVLFIADSVRFDSLPGRVADLGVAARGISPSTWTGSSIPSLLSGEYVPWHKVWNFDDRLPKPPYVLRSAANWGVNVEHVWGREYENDEKPTLKILNVDRHTRFGELQSPFVYVVHDHGGHPPYGLEEEQFRPSSSEYFESHVGREDRIVAQYHEGVERSADRFLRLVDRMDDRGLLDETLVVYTSDHGEILGEYGGIYGHNNPLVPEVVEVPVVFCGAGLPPGEELEELLSGTDIAPTALGARGRPIPGSMSGVDLWNGRPDPDRVIRSDVWKTTRWGTPIQYAASSTWDENGGVVLHRGRAYQRVLFALGLHLYLAPHAPLVRSGVSRRLPELLSPFLRKRIRYGAYDGEYDPERLLDVEFERSPMAGTVDVNEDQLRNLGYID